MSSFPDLKTGCTVVQNINLPAICPGLYSRSLGIAHKSRTTCPNFARLTSAQLVYSDDNSPVPDDQASLSLHTGHPLLLPGASDTQGMFDLSLQVRFLKGAAKSGESGQGYTHYRPPRAISAILEVDGIKSPPVPLATFARRNAPPAGCFGLLHDAPSGSQNVIASPVIPSITRGEPGSPVWDEDSTNGISLPATMTPVDWKGDVFVPFPIESPYTERGGWTNSTDVMFLAGFYKAAPAYQVVELEPARPAGRENLDPFVDWQGKGWFSTAESIKANDDPQRDCPSSCLEPGTCPATCAHAGGLCTKNRFVTCPAVLFCVVLNLLTHAQSTVSQPQTKFCDTNSGVKKKPINEVNSACDEDAYCAALRNYSIASIPDTPETQAEEGTVANMSVSAVMAKTVETDLLAYIWNTSASQFARDTIVNNSSVMDNLSLPSFNVALEFASRLCSDANDRTKVWCNRLRTVTPGSHTVRFEAMRDIFGTIPSGGTAADTTNYCSGTPFKVVSSVALKTNSVSVVGGDSSTVVSGKGAYTKIDTFQKGYGPYSASPLHIRVNRDRSAERMASPFPWPIAPGEELQIVPLRFPLGVPMTDTLPSALQQSMRHELERATPVHKMFVGETRRHFSPEPQVASRPFHIRWLFQMAFNDTAMNSLMEELELDPSSYVGGFDPEEPIDCSSQAQWDDHGNYNILLYHPTFTEDATYLYEVACLIRVDTNSMMKDIHFIAEDGPEESHYFWFRGGHLGVYGLALNDVGTGESAAVVATSGPVEAASIVITQQPCAEKQARTASETSDGANFRVDLGPCVVHDGCVSLRDYGTNQRCEVSVLSDSQLFLNYIDLEDGWYNASRAPMCYDFLQLDILDHITGNRSWSSQYCPKGPGDIPEFEGHGVAAGADSVLHFKSDGSITASGWTVCNRSTIETGLASSLGSGSDLGFGSGSKSGSNPSVVDPPAARCDSGKPLPDVGLRFDLQPTVHVSDAHGNPVQGLRIGAMFVSANETYGRGGNVFNPDGVNDGSGNDSLWDPLLFRDMRVPAMADIAPDDFQTTTGNRLSDPSDGNGLARFSSLTFVDALPGCYRVLFYVAYVS